MSAGIKRFRTRRVPTGGTMVRLVACVALGSAIVAACTGGGQPAASGNGGQSGAPVESPNAGSPAGSLVAGDPGTGTTYKPGEATATLITTGAPADASDVNGSWAFDDGDDVSPTSALVAAVWTTTLEVAPIGNVRTGDFVTISMGGPVADGTFPTSKDFSFGFDISRDREDGQRVYSFHVGSRAGECQITMDVADVGLTGTFECPAVTGDYSTFTYDAAGNESETITPMTLDAEGTFSL